MKIHSGKRPLLIMALFFALLHLGPNVAAQSAIYGAKDGPALEGYDTVAYFTENKAVIGNALFSFEWQGASWYFSSPTNRDLFMANPEQYAPQYGAHCAFGMANDTYASGDPHRWRIENNKLYLNTNKFAQWLWEGDIPTKIVSADEYWPKKKSALLTPKKE
jgi:YHS domain-containing protein